MNLFRWTKKNTMIEWEYMQELTQIEAVNELSRTTPVVIFKHSISCGISDLVKRRLERTWDVPPEVVPIFYLDLLSYRAVSNAVATAYRVPHESPQILLIKDGVCVFHASHLSITTEEIKAAIARHTTVHE